VVVEKEVIKEVEVEKVVEKEVIRKVVVWKSRLS
jgi:hypothetical protein